MYTLYTQTTEILHVRCSMCTHDLNLAVIYHLLCVSSLPSTLTLQIQYIATNNIILYMHVAIVYCYPYSYSFMVNIVCVNVITFLYLLLNIYTPASKKIENE